MFFLELEATWMQSGLDLCPLRSVSGKYVSLSAGKAFGGWESGLRYCGCQNILGCVGVRKEVVDKYVKFWKDSGHG